MGASSTAAGCGDSLQQTWYLVAGDGGNYSVRSESDGKCVDILNSKKADDAAVGSQTCSSATGGANQQWTVSDSQVAAGLALNHRNAPPVGCSSYSYCLKVSSSMNSRLMDAVSSTTGNQQQVVTNTTPSNGYWGVSFENSGNQQVGLFQLRSVGASGWCLTESSTTSLLAATKCLNTPGTTADQQQNWYLFAADNGSYSIRSAYDGRCADILNASNADGAGVGAWTCTSANGSVNEQWRLSDGKAASTLAAAFTKGQAQTCAHYINCLSFRSAMNNRSLDAIWWGSTTEQEAVTSMNPTNGLWGVTFYDPQSRIDGVFQLHPLAKPNWCLTEPASRSTSQMYVAPCVSKPGFPEGDRQEWRLFAGTNGNYSLRAAYDGYCADVLNGSNYDGAWVGSWSCSSGGGTSNQQWAVDDYSGSLSAPSAATNAALFGPKAGPLRGRTLAIGGCRRERARRLGCPGEFPREDHVLQLGRLRRRGCHQHHPRGVQTPVLQLVDARAQLSPMRVVLHPCRSAGRRRDHHAYLYRHVSGRVRVAVPSRQWRSKRQERLLDVGL